MQLYHATYNAGPWEEYHWVFVAADQNEVKRKVEAKLMYHLGHLPHAAKHVKAAMADSEKVSVVEHPLDEVVEVVDIE